MKLVGTGPAILAGLVVFLVPGLAFLGLLRPRDRDGLAADERLFLAVAVSVTASAWVALVLAELGSFSLLRAVAVLGLASTAAVAISGPRSWRWPLRRPTRAAEAVPALLLLGVALVFQARPTEYLMGGRDPGTYVASMALIARTGGIAYVDPGVQAIPAEDVELFYRNPTGPDFNWARFMGFPLERPQSARVVPEFLHLFPAFGAYLFQSMGVKGALATPPVFGVLGTLAIYFALRRIFGPAPALLATLLLALNVVQVWFARFPVSEVVSQFLVFLGLYAFVQWEESGSAAFGALAGTAFGVSLLVRIDCLLLLGPLGVYLLVRRAHRDLPWRKAAPLLVPLAALGVHFVLHASIWSRKYLLDIARRPYWKLSAAGWIVLGLALLATVAAVHAFGPALVRRLERHRDALQLGAMSLVAALALYAYFLRPVLSAWAGADGNGEASAVMTPWVPAEPLAHHALLDRLGFRRLAAHDAQAFLRLGWFVHPVGLWLAVLGLVLVIREWRTRYMLPVLVTLTFALFYFYKIRVYNDYFFALRRFLPVVLPFALAFAAFVLVRMAGRGGLRRVMAGLLAVGLGASYLHQTLPLRRYTDWKGSVAFVDDLARRFTPEDVVIFENKQSIHLLSLPLWAVHGVNVLELARFDPTPERLDHLIRAWRPRYRNIYFVYTYRSDLCGLFLQKVDGQVFVTQEWERSYVRPPRGPVTQALRFTVARVIPPEELSVPALDVVDIGGSDDFLVSGFYDKEGGYRWTGQCGSIYLPAARGARQVTIRACTGRRPGTLPPAVVRVSLSGVVLGRFEPSAQWATYTLPLPATDAAVPVLRLDVIDPETGKHRTWRPANVFTGDSDDRDLGVMVDQVSVVR